MKLPLASYVETDANKCVHRSPHPVSVRVSHLLNKQTNDAFSSRVDMCVETVCTVRIGKGRRIFDCQKLGDFCCVKVVSLLLKHGKDIATQPRACNNNDVFIYLVT